MVSINQRKIVKKKLKKVESLLLNDRLDKSFDKLVEIKELIGRRDIKSNGHSVKNNVRVSINNIRGIINSNTIESSEKDIKGICRNLKNLRENMEIGSFKPTEERHLNDREEQNLQKISDIIRENQDQKRKIPKDLEEDKIKKINTAISAYTKPVNLSHAKLNTTNIKYHLIYPGYVFEEQDIIIFNKNMSEEDALRKAKKKLKNKNITNLIVFESRMSTKLKFMWIIETQEHRKAGKFLVKDAKFITESESEIKNNVEDNKTKQKKLREEFKRKVNKETKRIDNKIENLKEELEILRQEPHKNKNLIEKKEKELSLLFKEKKDLVEKIRKEFVEKARG